MNTSLTALFKTNPLDYPTDFRNRIFSWVTSLLGGMGWLWCALLCFPIVLVGLAWFDFQSETWQHIRSTLLGELITNTVVLLIGVLLLSSFLGISLAWLNTRYNYPGRNWLEWALVLPLAIPAYILAVAFLGIFSLNGPVQSLLSELLGENYLQQDIRSPLTVILVMSLALYPYLYLLMRATFMVQGSALIEAAQSLGYNRRKAFLKVTLPAARPALIGGAGLILMETLAEFGAVSIFNYDTLTTGVYHTWIGLENRIAALQLASILLVTVLFFLTIASAFKQDRRYTEKNQHQPPERLELRGRAGWCTFIFVFMVFTLGFLLPILQLGYWSLHSLTDLDTGYWKFARNSLLLAVIVTVTTVITALLLVCAQRWKPGWGASLRINLIRLCYAMPGMVIAAGVVTLGGWALNLLPEQGPGMILRNLLMPGGITLLVLGCCARFSAPAIVPLHSGIKRIQPVLTWAAQSLGAGRKRIIQAVYLPLLLPALGSSLLVVFVETMREMPITLMLRPFGWDTLAVRIYEMSSEGEWQRAALPAFTLVLVGLLPVIAIMRHSAGRPVRYYTDTIAIETTEVENE